MGRKKIQISRITDERNRQVSGNQSQKVIDFFKVLEFFFFKNIFDTWPERPWDFF